MVHHIEHFFGCYLLYCCNPKYKGRTYVGFTVNPKRRIAQHNAGKHKGGAWRTSGRGPWHMTLIVHGFPSDIAALRFEWAWQHPEVSRRLKHIPRKTKKETAYQYKVRVLSHMLCERPWSILPLTVRWLMQEYYIELSPSPPDHIPIAYGPVEVKIPKGKEKVEEKESTNDDNYMSVIDRIEDKLKKLDEPAVAQSKETCQLCFQEIREKSLECMADCNGVFHTKCLAKHFLGSNPTMQLIPTEGNCPKCQQFLLWGDLIRKSKGFHQYLGNEDCS